MDSIPQNYAQGTFDFIGTPKKHCPGCGNDHPETEEYWHRIGSRFRVPCKECRHKQYLEHSTEAIARQRETFLAKSPEEQEKIRTHQNKRYRELGVEKRQNGLCSKCHARQASIGYLCEHCHTYQKQWGDDLRDQILTAYGGKCAICSESHPAFLAVDHINEDGAEHRRTTGGGHLLYRWLRKQGFPQEGFQLLCANCNWRKHVSQGGSEKTYIRQWRARLREETITAYGGKCACCGEDRQEVLTVDHVNGHGNEHRREVGAAGSPFYSWLRKQGFPQDGRFQLLCFNCNRARYYNGSCPHQK